MAGMAAARPRWVRAQYTPGCYPSPRAIPRVEYVSPPPPRENPALFRSAAAAAGGSCTRPPAPPLRRRVRRRCPSTAASSVSESPAARPRPRPSAGGPQAASGGLRGPGNGIRAIPRPRPPVSGSSSAVLLFLLAAGRRQSPASRRGGAPSPAGRRTADRAGQVKEEGCLVGASRAGRRGRCWQGGVSRAGLKPSGLATAAGNNKARLVPGPP